MALSEADTCRKYVVPKLQEAGWDNEPHSIAEQRSITDGRIVPVGKGFVRKPQQRPDYLLSNTASSLNSTPSSPKSTLCSPPSSTVPSAASSRPSLT